MDRRKFLKGVLGGVGMLTLPSVLTGAPLRPSKRFVEANVLGRLFRGTQDGRILESLDGGRTWDLIANFGEHCSILAILEHSSEIYTEVGLQGYSFFLRSPDGFEWYTVDQN